MTSDLLNQLSTHAGAADAMRRTRGEPHGNPACQREIDHAADKKIVRRLQRQFRSLEKIAGQALRIYGLREKVARAWVDLDLPGQPPLDAILTNVQGVAALAHLGVDARDIAACLEMSLTQTKNYVSRAYTGHAHGRVDALRKAPCPDEAVTVAQVCDALKTLIANCREVGAHATGLDAALLLIRVLETSAPHVPAPQKSQQTVPATERPFTDKTIDEIADLAERLEKLGWAP